MCLLCDEAIFGSGSVKITDHLGQPRRAHRVCMLREVMGGIGHLIAHEHWCANGDPDAGLTRYQSAQLVDAFIRIVGAAEAANRGIG